MCLSCSPLVETRGFGVGSLWRTGRNPGASSERGWTLGRRVNTYILVSTTHRHHRASRASFNNKLALLPLVTCFLVTFLGMQCYFDTSKNHKHCQRFSTNTSSHHLRIIPSVFLFFTSLSMHPQQSVQDIFIHPRSQVLAHAQVMHILHRVPLQEGGIILLF